MNQVSNQAENVVSMDPSMTMRTTHARRKRPDLPELVLQQIRAWANATDAVPLIRHTNLVSQVKIGFLYGLYAALLCAYITSDGHWAIQILGITVLGLFVIPFIRVFMHSQAHWRIGNGPLRNWFLDHAISAMFSVSQTGYKLGHWAHHFFDNDVDPRGFPKDLQSTYVFSRDGKPTGMLRWCFFYITVYQHAIHLFHVLNSRDRRNMQYYCIESLVIVAFHSGTYAASPGFYWGVYLPALVIAWVVAAVVLYMMHDVDLHESSFYHAVNSVDPLFNWFGDNDGYHIEHSLFPGLHSVFLKEANRLIRPPKTQELEDNYLIAGLRRLMRGAPGSEVGLDRGT